MPSILPIFPALPNGSLITPCRCHRCSARKPAAGANPQCVLFEVPPSRGFIPWLFSNCCNPDIAAQEEREGRRFAPTDSSRRRKRRITEETPGEDELVALEDIMDK